MLAKVAKVAGALTVPVAIPVAMGGAAAVKVAVVKDRYDMYRTATFWVIGAAMIAAAIVYVVYFSPFLTSEPKYSIDSTSYDVLMRENVAFAEAESFRKVGDNERAIDKYREALIGAEDTVQEGQIRLKLARLITEGTDYLTAVQQFKDVAKNPNYPRIERAYAIQGLTTLYYTYTSPDITEEIFKDAPFSELRDPQSVAGSYKNLADYGLKLFSLAMLNVRVAEWHAAEVLRLSKSGTEENGPLIASYKQIIAGLFTAAGADIERVKDDPNEAPVIASVYLRKANALGMLALSGDSSLGDPEEVFVASMNISAALGLSTEGYARVSYAVYLTRMYGESRLESVQELLSPFYSTGAYGTALVTKYFASARLGTPETKASLIELARIDEKFKGHLISQGWQLSDF